MTNPRTTLIIDTNYFLISRAFIVKDLIHTDQPESIKIQGCNELFSMILSQIGGFIEKNSPLITDVALVCDRGSWRKKLEIPESLKQQEITYKGHRKKQHLGSGFNPDWDVVWSEYDKFIKKLKEDHRLSIFYEWFVEGDDWARFLVEYNSNINSKLSENGENSKNNNIILWTTDNDWKQLLRFGNTFWYNGKVLYINQSLKDKNNIQKNTNPVTILNQGAQLNIFGNFDISYLNKNSNNSNYSQNNKIDNIEKFIDIFDKQNKLEYINPEDIITEKILLGDTSDNIFPIWNSINPQTGKRVNLTNKILEDFGISLDFNKHILPVNDENKENEKENNIIEVLFKKIKLISKFNKDSNLTPLELKNRFEYNKTLVFLDKSVIPMDIRTKMNEYAKAILSQNKKYYPRINSNIENPNIFTPYKEIYYDIMSSMINYYKENSKNLIISNNNSDNNNNYTDISF